VTQEDDKVAEQDADNDEDHRQTIGNVQESITVGRTRRNSRKPSWLIINMIIVYAFPVVRRQSYLLTRKLKSVRSRRCERMP